MQTNPEQWAVELWHLAYNASENCATQSFGDNDKAAALAIQAAFAEREARLAVALEGAADCLAQCATGEPTQNDMETWAEDALEVLIHKSMSKDFEMREPLEPRNATLAALKDRTHG